MCVTKVYGGRAEIKFHELKHYYTVKVHGTEHTKLYQPSVTTVLGMKDKSNALIPWAVNAMKERTLRLLGDYETLTRPALEAVLDAAQDSYRKKTQDACDVGTVVHRVLEQELLSRFDLAEKPLLRVELNSALAPHITGEMVDQINRSIGAGLQFYRENQIQLIQAEAPRWSPTYGYIGTGDLVARFNGELAILDYKTSKAIYSEYFLQTAAYQMAYEEEFPDQKILKRIVVHIGRDGVLDTQSRDNSTLEQDFEVFISLLKVWRWNLENQGKWSKPAPIVVGPLPN
jgi:hypothetical protein